MLVRTLAITGLAVKTCYGHNEYSIVMSGCQEILRNHLSRRYGGLAARVGCYISAEGWPHRSVDYKIKRVAARLQAAWHMIKEHQECSRFHYVVDRREAQLVAVRFGESKCRCVTNNRVSSERPNFLCLLLVARWLYSILTSHLRILISLTLNCTHDIIRTACHKCRRRRYCEVA